MIIEGKINSKLIKEFTKAAIDVELERIAIDCEFHIDCAEELISTGSNARDVWGFNIYPDGSIDFEAVYNIRPALNNRSMVIQDSGLKNRIRRIVEDRWQK